MEGERGPSIINTGEGGLSTYQKKKKKRKKKRPLEKGLTIIHPMRFLSGKGKGIISSKFGKRQGETTGEKEKAFSFHLGSCAGIDGKKGWSP